MRRNGNFPPLRETAAVAVTDGGKVESVGVLGEGSIGSHLRLELGDGDANDGGGELRRVNHYGVVLVIVRASVNRHRGIRVARRHRCPDLCPLLDAVIERETLELVHELVRLGAGFARLGGEEVGGAGGGGRAGLALALGFRRGGGGGLCGLGRLLLCEFPRLCRGCRGGEEAVGHGSVLIRASGEKLREFNAQKLISAAVKVLATFSPSFLL